MQIRKDLAWPTDVEIILRRLQDTPTAIRIIEGAGGSKGHYFPEKFNKEDQADREQCFLKKWRND